MRTENEIITQLKQSKNQFNDSWSDDRKLWSKINQKNSPFFGLSMKLAGSLAVVFLIVTLVFLKGNLTNSTQSLTQTEDLIFDFTVDDYIALYEGDEESSDEIEIEESESEGLEELF